MRAPWGPKFFHFHAVFGQKIRFAHPLGELVPPPRENPGSATGNFHFQNNCRAMKEQVMA